MAKVKQISIDDLKNITEGVVAKILESQKKEVEEGYRIKPTDLNYDEYDELDDEPLYSGNKESMKSKKKNMNPKVDPKRKNKREDMDEMCENKIQISRKELISMITESVLKQLK